MTDLTTGFCPCCPFLSAHGVSDFVHTILRDAFGLSDAEPTEDARTDLIVPQVARSRG